MYYDPELLRRARTLAGTLPETTTEVYDALLAGASDEEVRRASQLICRMPLGPGGLFSRKGTLSDALAVIRGMRHAAPE